MNYLVEIILDVIKLAIIFELGLHMKRKKEINKALHNSLCIICCCDIVTA